MVTGKKQRGEDGRPFRKIKNANLEPGKMPNKKIFNSRRSQRRPLKKINNRRSECRVLKICLIAGVVNAGLCHPVSKRTRLVIFLKPAFEFGFLFLKALLPYKTQFPQPALMLYDKDSG